MDTLDTQGETLDLSDAQGETLDLSDAQGETLDLSDAVQGATLDVTASPAGLTPGVIGWRSRHRAEIIHDTRRLEAFLDGCADEGYSLVSLVPLSQFAAPAFLVICAGPEWVDTTPDEEEAPGTTEEAPGATEGTLGAEGQG